jgi:hypothetical protein
VNVRIYDNVRAQAIFRGHWAVKMARVARSIGPGKVFNEGVNDSLWWWILKL